MSNDVNESKPAEESAACIALSKNDSYVMSASGGKVSLFNMMTFKVMTTFMAPPPAATYLAFHPQDNNIIAIGMEDSTIQIYNVRVDESSATLKLWWRVETARQCYVSRPMARLDSPKGALFGGRVIDGDSDFALL
ncbi:hypothetical protein M8C21_011659, partial [Ambrosia artemisiifolia]